MKKILKIICIILLVFFGLLIIFTIISYINHRIQLKKENENYISIGTQVEVNGHMMNVYSEGNSETTLVFMSGGGTCSPVLDFRSLYSLLINDYRIVVVEKAGYGFSDVADIKRDIKTVLYETREALKLAEIKGPFVLCPHSLSGIEALYWAQMYPNEIKAIIGLDMTVPQSYKDYQINKFLINLATFTANTGITRWFPSLAESDAIKYGTLSESEKELYRTIFYRRTATRSMLMELKQIKTNAKVVALNDIPDVPMLFFSSNGQGTGWDEEQWRFFQKEYINLVDNGTLVKLNCSHYVHDIEYTYISENIKSYLN